MEVVLWNVTCKKASSINIFVLKSCQMPNDTSKNLLPWKNVFVQVDLTAITLGTET